jgi:hypothetical protein
VDWIANRRYDEYLDHIELFSYSSLSSLGATSYLITAGDTKVNLTSYITGNLSVGNTITIGTETKEVIAINATSFLVNVNSAFASSYTSGNATVRVDNTYPTYANTFYVRNSKDQIFKCLYNNLEATSTIEPTIDIDGQLPENPYVEPGDGYKWKYMYSIPYGYKQKFFTRTWMPVLSDNVVIAGATDGRLDIIKILSGGTGYYLDGQSGNSNTLSIVTITGDGTGASVTARVQSGVITGLNILNGGSGYTTANVVISDPDQLANGTSAVFDTVIGPKGGHGSNPVKELGCYTVMTSVDLIGTESGKIPVGTPGTGAFDFRQISLVRDPKLANGVYANSTTYNTTTILTVSDPGITNFVNDETITVYSATAGTTFTATVIDWDASNNILAINNKNGTLSVGNQISGGTSGAVSTVTAVTDTIINIFSGDLLYMENRQKIVRDVDQTEQIRLILSF